MEFFYQATPEVAKQLLGKKLIYQNGSQRYAGYIVETEAYVGEEDQACHAFGGRRGKKNQSLYQEAGTIYAHAMHSHLLVNLVTQEAGTPQGVLIRAIEPVENIVQMEENRVKHGFELTNGPGKWTQAMNVDPQLDGHHLSEKILYLDETDERIPKEIAAGPRIGVPNKGEWTEMPLRFYVKGNPYVSRLKKNEQLPVEETWLKNK